MAMAVARSGDLGLCEHARGVEHDAAKAVVLAVGRNGAQSWRNSGGGVELRSVAAMVAFVVPVQAR
jgi:hypothetical protein